MSLRLTVTYSATDGTMPESVECTWEDVIPSPDRVLPILDRLLSAPADRLAATQPRRNES